MNQINQASKIHPKKLYSYIKSKKNENTGIALLRSEGTLHSNPSEKAKILSKQFQSAFTSEENTNIPVIGPSTHPTMEPIKISRDGVYKFIKNINPSEATGPDTIAGRVLKENIDICTDILTLLFTKSLETGKVPSDWNHANVTPVLRKGDKHNPGNYRNISLTCIACKLLGTYFCQQHDATSRNQQHTELQHRFRAKRSCESQIISLIHELSQKNDKNIQIYNNNGLCKSFRQGTTQKTAVQNEILWHIRTNHKLG